MYPGAISNGNTPQFPVTAAPAPPTLTGTAIPAACVTTPNAPLANLATDGVYATCNGSGVLTLKAPNYSTTTATAPTRNVTYVCKTGTCESTPVTLSYVINALPAAPSAAGTIAQQCINTLPILAGATCASGSTAKLWNEGTSALATAADFATVAAVGLQTVCVNNTTGCISTLAAIYPAAAPGSAGGSGGSYTPAATPATPVAANSFIAAYSTFPTQVSTPAVVNNAAQVCSNAGAKVINFSTTACGTATAVVYDAATGGTPLWASAAITIGGVAVPTAPITAPATSTDYYIACNSNATAFCESGRYKLVYKVVAKPEAPTVATIPDGCQDAPFSDDYIKGLATCATGKVTVTTASPFHVASTPGFEVASVTYKCVLDGCESDAKTVKYTILARPSNAGLGTMLANVCEIGNTGAGMIGIATHDCPVGTSPYVTSAATGSTKLGLNGALFSQATGTVAYKLFCQNDAGCSSAVGFAVSGTVNARPITPFNLSLSSPGAACPTTVANFNVIATCTGATTEKLHVYTVAAGGTSIANATATPSSTPVAISGANKPTATTTYYVECISAAGCISDRVMAGTYTVGAGLDAATAVLKSSTLCLESAAAATTIKLTFVSNSCPAGTTLKVYQAATGNAVYAVNGSMEIAVPGVNPADAGNKNVYVVCRDAGGCESETRTAIPYTLNAFAVPTAAGKVTRACVNTLPVLTDATCPSGNVPVLIISTGAIAQASDFTGGVKAVAVACQNTTTGCVTPWSSAPWATLGGGTSETYSPIATPAAPTATLIGAYKTAGGSLDPTTGTRVSKDAAFLSPATVCTADGATVLHFAATCAGAQVAVVYDAATGGTPVWSSADITLGATAVTGGPNKGIAPPAASKDYYIACNSNTPGFCESTTRVKVSYVVVTTPDAPVASAPAACSGTTITYTATCTAGDLFRYNNAALTTGEATGAAALTATAPTVLDGTPPATFTRYFVCKTTTGGCVGKSTQVDVTVSARPAKADAGPAVVTITPSTSCDGMGSITNHNCAVGNDYFASTSNTGAPVLGLNGAPFNAGTATVTLYVFCRNAAGCLSDPTTVTFTPIAKPIAPANISLSKTSATCPTTVTNFTITATCTGAGTDELAIYTTAAGGTALKKEPVAAGSSSTVVTIGGATKPTETTTYYVACESPTGCKSDRVMAGTFTVGPAGAATTATLKETTVCVGTQLEISSACAGTLTVYQAATGPDVWTVSAAGKVQGAATNAGKVGDNNLYVTCTVDGCESGTRTAVPYTVVPNVGIAVPNIDSPAPAGAYCSGTEFTLRGNCAATDTKVIFYDFATSTVLATLPVVDLDASPGTSWGATYKVALTNATAANKDYDYRVKCSNDVCESALSAFGTITIRPDIAAPVVTLSPAIVCGSAGPTAILSSSTCGVLETVWYNATTNTKLASLPALSTNIPGTYSYYAKCKKNAPDCESPASNIVSYTVTTALPQPTVTSSSPGVACSGSPVTFTSNCPVGSTPLWTNVSTGVTSMGATLVVTLNNPGSQTVTVKCTQTGGCDSPVSASATATWSSIFDLTIINIGASKSGIKPGAGVPKSAWASNFVTVDAGAPLLSSTQANPSIFYTENPNKVGPRFWTIHVETCAFGTDGAISYDMLVTPETGPQQSFNTVENNAPYLMYANRDGFTELYAQNNPFFGFFADNGSGGNKYDAGLPKGLYKLSIRYWSQKGLGIAPAVRVPQGSELAYQEHWFRIQSMQGIGGGSGAREGVSETSEVAFATVAPNPVTRTLTLAINGAKGQEVKMNLVDAAGRIIKSSTVTPETNTHREEVDMSTQTTGMYFMNISTPTKRANLKVLKVSND